MDKSASSGLNVSFLVFWSPQYFAQFVLRLIVSSRDGDINSYMDSDGFEMAEKKNTARRIWDFGSIMSDLFLTVRHVLQFRTIFFIPNFSGAAWQQFRTPVNILPHGTTNDLSDLTKGLLQILHFNHTQAAEPV